MTTARPALGTHSLAGKRRHFDIVGILRDVDQTLMSARIVEASGDKVLWAAS
jgi:hypothetical protein